MKEAVNDTFYHVCLLIIIHNCRRSRHDLCFRHLRGLSIEIDKGIRFELVNFNKITDDYKIL